MAVKEKIGKAEESRAARARMGMRLEETGMQVGVLTRQSLLACRRPCILAPLRTC